LDEQIAENRIGGDLLTAEVEKVLGAETMVSLSVAEL